MAITIKLRNLVMRLEQIQAFLTVAETGSFQQAAKRCNVTQSTISRQVQTLEGVLGVPLLHRTSHVKLTVAGECFLPRARKIYQEWNSATVEIQDLIEGKQPELCIAAIHSVCAYQLPPVLQRFCAEYPEVQLRVTSLGSDRALKVLKDGLVDLVIVMNNRFLTASADMIVDHLYTEPVQVLMSANHPLAQSKMVPWERLVHYPQVVFKDGYGMQRLVQEQFQKQGVKLNAALELNTLDAFRGVVRQGELVALLPQGAIADLHLDPMLVMRPTNEPVITRDVVLVTTSDRLQIPPIKRFRELVQQQMQSSPLGFSDKLVLN
jgi:DNA-binding transcriptional LysR family regulator